LAAINNGSLKELVSRMYAAKLSAQSIVTYANLTKLIVGSACDANGEQLFPRKWNHEFIDLPIIDKQHRPIVSGKTVSSIVAQTTGTVRSLFIVLAGTGLRIGEALGLEVKHVSPDGMTLKVEQSCWEGDIQTPKTKNAFRFVDVCPVVGEVLREQVNGRASGLLFANRKGEPLHQSNLLRRDLHPALKRAGVEPCGFHAFRRHRTTWLRKKRAPEDCIRFWLGHAHSSITDIYDQVEEDREYRLEVALKVGIDFSVSA
jgi:integrase